MALNKEKLSEELGEWLHTFRDPPRAQHKDGVYVNRLVEACRVSPYAAGHIEAVLFPLVPLLALLLWWRW